MVRTTQFRKMMDSIAALFICLMIFVVRATVSVWSTAGVVNRVSCVLAILACFTGVAISRRASNLGLPQGSFRQ